MFAHDLVTLSMETISIERSIMTLISLFLFSRRVEFRPLLLVVLLDVVDRSRRRFSLTQFHCDMFSTVLVRRFIPQYTQNMMLQPEGINDGTFHCKFLRVEFPEIVSDQVGGSLRLHDPIF